MMTKRIMATCLALVMVCGMSLTSFAADVNPAGSKNYTRVNISDFQRLLNVCNEKYGPFEKTLKKPDGKGGYEVAKESLKVNDKGESVGVVEPVGPDPDGVGKSTDNGKLTSIHDVVAGGRKVNFVNGKRLSNTEFVIRVTDSVNSKESKTFAGDYYVSVVPYKTVINAQGQEEAIDVPGENSAVYGCDKFGPAWFFCKLFDDEVTLKPVIDKATGMQKYEEKDGQQKPVYEAVHNTVGYLVAQRITRWPNNEDLRFVYPDFEDGYKDGVKGVYPSPTYQAKDAFARRVKYATMPGLFPNVANWMQKVYDAPSSDDWFETVSKNNPNW